MSPADISVGIGKFEFNLGTVWKLHSCLIIAWLAIVLFGCYDDFLAIFNLVPYVTINNSEKTVSKIGRIGSGPLPKPLRKFPCHSNLVISISNFPTFDCAKFKYCSSDYPKGF